MMNSLLSPAYCVLWDLLESNLFLIELPTPSSHIDDELYLSVNVFSITILIVDTN